MNRDIIPEETEKLYQRLKKEAESSGYYLNPDIEFAKALVKSLLINEGRYGYWACPCRLAAGEKGKDLDIICPCDYRDADIVDYDACYCALYVSHKIIKGEKKLSSIPERRPLHTSNKERPASARLPARQEGIGTPEAEREKATDNPQENKNISSLPLPVWRCKVCGYLCARENPPEICPICKAKKERFERFM
jgi:ferredoxin-thioredoxin reductase catalytic subunit